MGTTTWDRRRGIAHYAHIPMLFASAFAEQLPLARHGWFLAACLLVLAATMTAERPTGVYPHTLVAALFTTTVWCVYNTNTAHQRGRYDDTGA